MTPNNVESPATTRIAVIGIGSAGLAQLKQLIDAFNRPDVRVKTQLELVGYEGRGEVGGLWNYDPDPPQFIRNHIGGDKRGEERTLMYPPEGCSTLTAVYEGLTATLPHELMSYREYAFPTGTPVFPTSKHVNSYLRSYAKAYGLYDHIRFHTIVERLYRNGDSSTAKWTIESCGPGGWTRDTFDYVVVSNGHYNDPWIPPSMKGLSSFPGKVIHSREYRKASDYAGKTVLVVGSFSSGSDITRLVAGLNVRDYSVDGHSINDNPRFPFTKVYQSSTGLPNSSFTKDVTEPWNPFIRRLPLIDHFEPADSEHPKGRVYFVNNEVLDDVDVVIFATGYSNLLPFCKITDEPWRSNALLDEVVQPEERKGGDQWEVGGLRGLCMRGMDTLLLFLRGDRSIAFIGLTYQIVPFPFAEVQARLVSLLWAGLLPSFPANPRPPPNGPTEHTDPSDVNVEGESVASGAIRTGGEASPSSLDRKVRVSVAQRGEFVFPNPYEWVYTEYLFGLMREADEKLPPEKHWQEVEAWRRAQRADTGMRKRVLGY